MLRPSLARPLLMAAPPLLLATTWAVFSAAVSLWGMRGGYFAGFAFYWVGWCLLLPAIILRGRILTLFRTVARPLGARPALAALALAAPLLLGFGYAFPRALPHASVLIVATSALLAIVNATCEEILWRGTYLAVFPDSRWWGWLYPTLGFAVWHFAPQSVFPNPAPGGNLALVVVAGVVGFGWAWVARTTGSLRWTTLAHILFDFSGLGGRLYFG